MQSPKTADRYRIQGLLYAIRKTAEKNYNALIASFAQEYEKVELRHVFLTESKLTTDEPLHLLHENTQEAVEVFEESEPADKANFIEKEELICIQQENPEDREEFVADAERHEQLDSGSHEANEQVEHDNMQHLEAVTEESHLADLYSLQELAEVPEHLPTNNHTIVSGIDEFLNDTGLDEDQDTKGAFSDDKSEAESEKAEEAEENVFDIVINEYIVYQEVFEQIEAFEADLKMDELAAPLCDVTESKKQRECTCILVVEPFEEAESCKSKQNVPVTPEAINLNGIGEHMFSAACNSKTPEPASERQNKEQQIDMRYLSLPVPDNRVSANIGLGVSAVTERCRRSNNIGLDQAASIPYSRLLRDVRPETRLEGNKDREMQLLETSDRFLAQGLNFKSAPPPCLSESMKNTRSATEESLEGHLQNELLSKSEHRRAILTCACEATKTATERPLPAELENTARMNTLSASIGMETLELKDLTHRANALSVKILALEARLEQFNKNGRPAVTTSDSSLSPRRTESITEQKFQVISAEINRFLDSEE